VPRRVGVEPLFEFAVLLGIGLRSPT
jgi:hypothetical protein